jgi:tetratricopeptide (TPR) repeat protein
LPLRAKGEFAQVIENMRQALTKPGQPVKRGTMAHEHDVYFLLSESAAHLSDVQAIEQYARRLEELAARDDHKLYLGIAQRTLGIGHRLAGEYPEAGMRLNQALLLFNEAGAPWQVGRTLYALGEFDQQRGDLPSAQNHFQRALEIFEMLGAQPDTAKVKTALENFPTLDSLAN